MKVHEMKAEFVANELTALLRKIDKTIDRAEYIAQSDGEEFVKVYGANDRMVKRVCVTADSLCAITLDVLRAIG